MPQFKGKQGQGMRPSIRLPICTEKGNVRANKWNERSRLVLRAKPLVDSSSARKIGMRHRSRVRWSGEPRSHSLSLERGGRAGRAMVFQSKWQTEISSGREKASVPKIPLGDNPTAQIAPSGVVGKKQHSHHAPQAPRNEIRSRSGVEA